MTAYAKPSLHLLQIAPRMPWPLDTGAKLRNFHLGRVMSQQARIALLAFDTNRDRVGNLDQLYQPLISIRRDGHNSLAKLLRGVVGKTPLPLLNYTSPQMAGELEILLRASEFDVVQFESIHLMPYIEMIRASGKRTLAVLDWHNMESALLQQYAKHEANTFRRAYARRTAKLMGEAERRAAHEFDAHIVVSEQDARRLRE